MKLYDNILTDIDSKYISGLTTELKGLFLYKKFKKENKPILCVTSSIYEANKLYQTVLNYTDKVSFFPMDDFLTSEALAISPEFKYTRLDTLNKILKENQIVITNLMGFLRFMPDPKTYKEANLKIELNKDYNQEKLIMDLYKLGYKKESLVNKTGEVAIRGYIIEIGRAHV